jgi:uncharacterized protein (DUF2132 family)
MGALQVTMRPFEIMTSNSLQGITLEHMLTALVTQVGWEKMASQIDIRCFSQDPSIQSSLKFLRRTPWARAKVEALFVQHCVH